MSWQADLRTYVALRQDVASVEARGCTCNSDNFHTCEPCQQSAEMYQEMRRLLDLWGDLWACKLYRTAQGIEPITPVDFKKEAA